MADEKRPKTEDLTGLPTFVENLLSSGAIQAAATGEVDLDETHTTKKAREIREMENAILRRGLEVIDAVSRFGEVDPAKPEEPSRSMIEDFGHDLERLATVNRTARYALMSASEAPVAINMMSRVVVGLVRARAVEKPTNQQLNVAVLNIGGGLQLPEHVIEDEEQ